MGGWRPIALAAALYAFVLPCGWSSAAERPAVARLSGTVGGQPEVADGVVTTAVYPFNAHFLIDTTNTGQRSKALALLEQARRENKEIIVTFDPANGIIDLSNPTPLFRMLELDYGATRLAIDQTSTGKAPAGAGGSAAKAVATGVGLKYAGDWDGAKAQLTAALTDPALPPAIRGLAYETLGNMAQDEGEAVYRPQTAESDQALMEALDDFRSERAEALYSTGPRIEVANILVDLGAYDEALAIYKDLVDSGKSQGFWSRIAAGYIHRTMGDYAQSLRDLDELARKQGPMNNMPYHYHRGLTLLAMGRDAEAADEFTAGLKFQPDYAWAIMHRACAYGRLGRLADALADARRASDLQAQIVNQKAFAREAFNKARLASIIGELSAAVAAGKPAKVDSACSGFWPDGLDHRARSALLPKVIYDDARTAP